MQRVWMQRARRSEVMGKHFGIGHGLALWRSFKSMVMWEWDKAGHSVPEDSFMKGMEE